MWYMLDKWLPLVSVNAPGRSSSLICSESTVACSLASDNNNNNKKKKKKKNKNDNNNNKNKNINFTNNIYL